MRVKVLSLAFKVFKQKHAAEESVRKIIFLVVKCGPHVAATINNTQASRVAMFP